MRPIDAVIVLALLWTPGAKVARAEPGMQARPPARRPAVPAPPVTKTEPAAIKCPNPLGEGVQTKQSYCDVLTGREPADGIIVDIPPHVGPVTLTFDLHNRHMYSEELVKTNRGYRRYTATIGVLTMDTASDLVDRISGGAGPGGVKAVAPTGLEPISVTIPAEELSVSILGEKVSVVRLDGVDNFTLPGQPVAIISNVMLQYRPAPPKRTPVPRRR